MKRFNKRCPNSVYYRQASKLFPAILRACRLLNTEGLGILYRENYFSLLYIDTCNPHAAFITHGAFGAYVLEEYTTAHEDAVTLSPSLQCFPSVKDLRMTSMLLSLSKSELAELRCYLETLTIKLWGMGYHLTLTICCKYWNTVHAKAKNVVLRIDTADCGRIRSEPAGTTALSSLVGFGDISKKHDG